MYSTRSPLFHQPTPPSSVLRTTSSTPLPTPTTFNLQTQFFSFSGGQCFLLHILHFALSRAVKRCTQRHHLRIFSGPLIIHQTPTYSSSSFHTHYEYSIIIPRYHISTVACVVEIGRPRTVFPRSRHCRFFQREASKISRQICFHRHKNAGAAAKNRK